MSAHPNDGGPAFPIPSDGHTHGTEGGMTLRDWFAGHCPPVPEQWYLDSPRKKSDPTWHWGEASAAWAYFYADAMIRAREVQA